MIGYHEHLPPSPPADGGRAAAEGAAATEGGGGGRDPGGLADSAAAPRFSPSSQPFRTDAFLKSHCGAHGAPSRALPAQLVQTQGFYVLVDEYGSKDPYGWYRTACTACRRELAELGGPEQATNSQPGVAGNECSERVPAAAACGPAASDTSVSEPSPVVFIIGTPADDGDGSDASGVSSSAAPLASGRRSFCRPCPLLQRRKAPVYRSFPSLHVSDQLFADAISGPASAGSASATVAGVAALPAPWHGWQAHIRDPWGTADGYRHSSGGAAGGGGSRPAGADAAAAGGGIGAGSPAAAILSRKRPLGGSRRNRSLSGSISGDLTSALVSELSQPRYRISSGGVATTRPSAAEGPGAANGSDAAAGGGGGGNGGDAVSGGGGGRRGHESSSVASASSPAISELPHTLRSAAAAVAAEASSISASFSSTLSNLSHTIRQGARKALSPSPPSASAAPSAAASPPGPGVAATAAASGAAGHGLKAAKHHHHHHHYRNHHHNHHSAAHTWQLADYAAERELLRQQVAALTRLLSWGEPPPPPQSPPPPQRPQPPPPPAPPPQRHRSGGGGPDEAEVERVWSLLCLQAAGKGAFLLGRLREQMASASTSTCGSASASASASASGSTSASASASVSASASAGGQGATAASPAAARAAHAHNQPARSAASPSSAATTSTGGASSRNRNSSSAGGGASAGGAGGGASTGGGGRCLHRAAYGVLADAFDALVSAAVQQQDFGVLADALELSTRLHTFTSCKVPLLHSLPSNPLLFTRYAWVGMFSHKLRTTAVEAATAATMTGAATATATAVAAKAASEGGAAPAPGAGAETGAGAGAACCASLDAPDEALRRQRLLLQGLHRSLCAFATWLMHLGVLEEAAWELLSGLVAASGVAELPAAREAAAGGQPRLQQALMGVRAALRAARCDAFPQHRRRMLEPGCGGGGGLQRRPVSPPHRWPVGRRRGGCTSLAPAAAPPPPPPAAAATAQQQEQQQVPQLPRRRPLASRRSLDSQWDVGRTGDGGRVSDPRVTTAESPAAATSSAVTAVAAAAAAATASPGAAAPQQWATAGRDAAAAAAANTTPTAFTTTVGPPRSPGGCPPSGYAAAAALRASITSLAGVKALGPGGDSPGGGGGGKRSSISACRDRSCGGGPLSPTLNTGCIRSPAGGGGAAGSTAGKAYIAQYERQLSAAAAAMGPSRARVPSASLGGARAAASIGQQPEQARTPSGAGVAAAVPGGRRRPAAAMEGRPAACAVVLGSGRPVVALAAASGAVLAAPQEPFAYLLSCQADGSLRIASRLPLAHLDAAYADRLDMTPDGGTAALSVAPMPPPQPARAPARAQACRSHGGAPSASALTGPAGGGAAAGAAAVTDVCRSRVLALVDVAAGRIVRELRQASRSRVTALTLSPTANLLASGCAASWARLWDARVASNGGGGGGSSGGAAAGGGGGRCAPVLSMATRQDGVSALLLESGRLRLYTGGRDGTAAEWDLRKPSCPVRIYSGHDGWVTSLELLHPAVAATAADSSVCSSHRTSSTRPDAVRLTRSLDSLAAIKAAERAAAASLEPLEPCLVTGSTDWTVRVWGRQVSEPAVGGGAGSGGTVYEAARPGGRSSAPGAAAPGVDGEGGGNGGGGSRGAGGGDCGGGAGGGAAAAAPPTAACSAASAWDQVPCCRQPRAVLLGHGAAITSLHIDKRASAAEGAAVAIYTGAQDGSVGAWTADGRCRLLLPCHGGAVTLLATATPPLTQPAPARAVAAVSPNAHHCNGYSSSSNIHHRPFEQQLSSNIVGSVPLGWSGAPLGPAGAAAAAAFPASVSERMLVTSGADGSAGLWSLTRGSAGYTPLLERSETESLARVAAWDAARGVLLRGDERGVVRAWAPGMSG
ncbi:Scytalone dehydratase [Pleodorina starrii]|nr:Scytalone dehydratase [Pleodorina starrii]